MSVEMIRSLFARWQRLEAEKAAIADDLKELFAEAKGSGFNTKALRIVFREQVADDGDREKAEELDAICDLYRASLVAPRARPAPARTREAQEFAAPHTSEVDGGRPHPSSDAAGAKSDVSQAIAGQQAETAVHRSSKSEQQDASPSQDRNEPVSDGEATATVFEPPAFLTRAKTVADYRPHCLHPENCGAAGLKHCHACVRALNLESEAA